VFRECQMDCSCHCELPATPESAWLSIVPTAAAAVCLQVKLLERRGEEAVPVAELATYLVLALGRHTGGLRRRTQPS
jgi:hypothetical protein